MKSSWKPTKILLPWYHGNKFRLIQSPKIAHWSFVAIMPMSVSQWKNCHFDRFSLRTGSIGFLYALGLRPFCNNLQRRHINLILSFQVSGRSCLISTPYISCVSSSTGLSGTRSPADINTAETGTNTANWCLIKYFHTFTDCDLNALCCKHCECNMFF